MMKIDRMMRMKKTGLSMCTEDFHTGDGHRSYTLQFPSPPTPLRQAVYPKPSELQLRLMSHQVIKPH